MAVAEGHNGIRPGTKDDTAYLQGIIDSWPNRSELVPPGVYYISRSLRVGPTKQAASGAGQPNFHCLIGTGPSQTIIAALDSRIDLITGNGYGGSYQLCVAGVTLQGGANGILLDKDSLGPHAQITDSFISHILFKDMSNAGIFMKDLYGLDNNLFSYLSYVNCSTSFLQVAPPSQRVPGGDQRCKPPFDNPSMTYMDKTVFYRNHVQPGPTAVRGFDLRPCRGDNLNMWFECEFDTFDGSAIFMQGNSMPIIASSSFHGVRTAVDSTGVMLVNSLIEVGRTTQVAVPDRSFVEGCNVSLAEGGNTSATLFGLSGGSMQLLHNFFGNFAFGPTDRSYSPTSGSDIWSLLNNRFANQDLQAWNRMAIEVTNSGQPGNNTVYFLSTAESTNTPVSQLLFGSDW